MLLSIANQVLKIKQKGEPDLVLYLGVTEGTTLIRKTVIELGLQAKFLAYHLPELPSGGSFSPLKLRKEKSFKIPVPGSKHQMEKEVPLSIRAVFL